ncbi:hypothetical protein PV08_04782 [Exophiala spinifera]|uniref:Transcription factor domain-containing protein n=1 Tax=Exophiala spinifera TaxID=91928 RepID=A0A0D1ZY70_9EURO|nr:uncharacterized protein PV08_04782 [Exophiala spinifera]KIW17587.1 hypothetical protein PV08_04782 [Exophiala spinifera]
MDSQTNKTWYDDSCFGFGQIGLKPLTHHALSKTLSEVEQAAAHDRSGTFGPFSVIKLADIVAPVAEEPYSISSADHAESSSEIVLNHLSFELPIMSVEGGNDDATAFDLDSADSPKNRLTTLLVTNSDDDSLQSISSGFVLDCLSLTELQMEDSPVFDHPRSKWEATRDIGGIELESDDDYPLTTSTEFAESGGSSLDDLHVAVYHPETNSARSMGLSLSNERPLSLFSNSTTAMLVHHFEQYLICLMQPVYHLQSPFKTIYLATALQGCPDLNMATNGSQASIASTAVFHSILTCAAINLQALRSNAGQLSQLAYYHKQTALSAARKALTTKKSTYRELMTAILSLVSVDVADGGTQDHWIHLDAARRLQESRHDSRLVTHETRQLDSICTMLNLFARTALYNSDPKPWAPGIAAGILGESNFNDLHSNIEFLYGITPSIARAIFKITELSNSLAYYRHTSQDVPQSLLAECERVGDELAFWTVESEPLSSIEEQTTSSMQAIAHAQVSAFYNATLIYYFRSIQDCDRRTLREEQTACLDAMNRAEDLKEGCVRNSTSGFAAPISWPAFVASCEAVGEQRKRWEKWWARVQSYRVENYARQRDMVYKIWDALDARAEESQTGHGSAAKPTDWKQALYEMGVRIIPI